jgi:hypothetical protein
MLGEEHAILNFDRVLSYAVRVSERYQRELSLVMLSGGNGNSDVPQMFSPHLRRSDELLEFRDCAAVLMGETGGDGALKAVARFQKVLDGKTDVRYAIASFPEDGEAAGKLFMSARRRLDLAWNQGPGAVVATG